MKKCNKCLIEKEVFAFDKNRNTCRKCRNYKNTKKYLENPENIEKRRIYMREYMQNKYNNSEEYKRYNSLLKILTKKLFSKKNKDIDFIQELEKKFDENMNWDNYGIYWEIDHILPVLKMIKMGYTDDEINDIKNIRPLKIEENRSRLKKSKEEYLNLTYKKVKNDINH